MSAEHAELVMEMPTLEKMTHQERVKLAKRRRTQQLKVYQQYEKKMEKEMKSSRRMKLNDKNRLQKDLQFAQSTLLFDAAIRNDLEEAESLLQSGVSPNLVGGDSLSVLHQCCLNDLLDMMKLFMHYGADVNAKDCDLWTPLHLAATCGNIALCQCLCDNNADLLALNTDGNMPYDLCDDMPTLDFIESEMAKKGITQELIDETRLTSENHMLDDMKKFSNEGGDLNMKGPNGEALLHIAACTGYGRVIDYLISKKTPVNCCDNDNWQAHHMATYYGQFHVLESLLLAGADPYAKTSTDDTMLDLCDFDAQPKIQALIVEIQNRGTYKLVSSATLERNNSTRRGSQATLHTGRRSSIHDKATIAHREAIMEGQRLQGSIVMTSEEDEDEGDKDDFIEIPAITVSTIKAPVIKVGLTKTPVKSILKKPATKTPSMPKNNLDISEIWTESQSPPVNKKSEPKYPDGGKSSKSTGKSFSPPINQETRDATTNGKSIKQTTNNNNTAREYSKSKSSEAGKNPSPSEVPSNQQNGQTTPPAPGTLANLKQQRKMLRDNQQPNGNTRNKNSNSTRHGLSAKDSKKQQKYTNENEVVSGEDSNKCCIVS